MGTKGGTILYHIGYGGYGTTLGCFATSGVTICCQLKCWAIDVGWVTKLDHVHQFYMLLKIKLVWRSLFKFFSCSNWFKSWLRSNSKSTTVGFKIGIGSDV